MTPEERMEKDVEELAKLLDANRKSLCISDVWNEYYFDQSKDIANLIIQSGYIPPYRAVDVVEVCLDCRGRAVYDGSSLIQPDCPTCHGKGLTLKER